LPIGGGRMGVGAADFDNDGFVDVYLPSIGSGNQRIVDVIARNLGNGTFELITDHGAVADLTGDVTYPAGGQPFDFDNDGRVDVIVGTRTNANMGQQGVMGHLNLFRNVVTNGNSYLIVKVPLAINGFTTMDALLELQTSRGSFYRRVGSVGEGRASSYINHVHFGLGQGTTLASLQLTLIQGGSPIVRSLASVPVNSLYELIP